jgi:hypothetical protein
LTQKKAARLSGGFAVLQSAFVKLRRDMNFPASQFFVHAQKKPLKAALKFMVEVCNLAANFVPEDFLRSNDKKVRRSNMPFYREL